jgi:hypothetical protein
MQFSGWPLGDDDCVLRPEWIFLSRRHGGHRGVLIFREKTASHRPSANLERNSLFLCASASLLEIKFLRVRYSFASSFNPRLL